MRARPQPWWPALAVALLAMVAALLTVAAHAADDLPLPAGLVVGMSSRKKITDRSNTRSIIRTRTTSAGSAGSRGAGPGWWQCRCSMIALASNTTSSPSCSTGKRPSGLAAATNSAFSRWSGSTIRNSNGVPLA